MPTNITPVISVMAALTAMCTASLAGQAVATTTRDSAGVQIIVNAGATRVLPSTLELRIGQEDGAPEQMLYNVYAVTLDPGGNHYIGMEAEIRVFDSAGRYVRTIGRRGKGPGEFGMPPFPIWFSGDSIMAMDRNLMRTTAFNAQGKVLGTYTSYGHRGLVVRPIAPGDSAWVAIVEERIDDVQPGDAERRSNQYPQLRPGQVVQAPPIELRQYFPRNDSLGATLFRIQNEKVVGISDEPGYARRPFDDKPSYTVNSRGIAFAKVPTTYQVDVYDGRGRHVRSIRREYSPIPIRKSDFEGMPELLRDAYAMNVRTVATSREQFMERMLRSMEQRVDRMRSLPLPPHRSPVGRILASAEGMLWVERADFHEPALREALLLNDRLPVPTRWDVFDRRGAYQGTADFPVGFRPLAVNDAMRVTGAVISDLGVEFVVTYRVHGPARDN